MARVLDGIRVLDLGRYLAGPIAGAFLADMGAEVIRVEKPGGEIDRELGPFAPNGESFPYGLINHRNKKAITLDLDVEAGRQVFRDLVKRSDVVMDNFALDAKTAKGLTYDSLKQVNPAIIYVSVTGFGLTGPYAHRSSFDPGAQAMSGAMSFTGFPGNPPTREALPWVDFSTGLSAALGTMFALYHRKSTGQGQMVDLSLVDTAVALLGAMGVAAESRVLGHLRPQIGNHGFYNFSNCFQTRDGWIFVMCVGNSLWRRFTRVIGRPEWGKDLRFKDNMSRFDNRSVIVPVVAEWMSQRSSEEVIKLLEAAQLPFAPVYNAQQVTADPHIQARQALVDIDYPGIGPVPHFGTHIKLSETPGIIERRAPELGEHNEVIYCGLLGYGKDRLAQLRAEGVI